MKTVYTVIIYVAHVYIRKVIEIYMYSYLVRLTLLVFGLSLHLNHPLGVRAVKALMRLLIKL